jgi:hypothetical protein
MSPFGPGAGAKRKDGEDDGEHRSPSYLRRVAPDWTEGLAAPVDVIGADQVPPASPSAETHAATYTFPGAPAPSAKPVPEPLYYDDTPGTPTATSAVVAQQSSVQPELGAGRGKSPGSPAHSAHAQPESSAAEPKSVTLSTDTPLSDEQAAELRKPTAGSVTITIAGAGPMGGDKPATEAGTDR